MSRHRNVRNRAYSYEAEDYDEDYDDEVPDSPTSQAFLYRRDSPSRQHSLLSFVQPDASPPPPPEPIDTRSISLGAPNRSIASSTVEIPVPRLETVAFSMEKTATKRLESTFEAEKSRKKADEEETKKEKTKVERAARLEHATQKKAEEMERLSRENGKQKLNLVVIGHVDAGKSTLTGHLLVKCGAVSQKVVHKYEKEAQAAGKASKHALAWVMDADASERARGVTMDVGLGCLATPTKHVTLLDAPGHRDFIPKMIAGASQADVALLVVPAAMGEFEAAFEHSGQTKEHTLLVRSLGVSHLLVAINKMDMVEWDQERFDEIVAKLTMFLEQVGFRRQNLQFVPLSGMTGGNLDGKSKEDKCVWYTGLSLVEAIDALMPPRRQIAKPFRMTVADVSKSMSLGHTISGRIYAGAAAVGDSFLLMPVGLPLTIKGMEQDGQACPLARAGDTIEMGVTGIDPSALTTGSIVCSIASPVRLATKFEAKIMTMPAVDVPIVKGTCVTLHLHNVDEPANITRLLSVLTKTGEIEKKRPRCITRERSAVVQITCQRRICVEEFADYRQLGRFTLRDRGKTLAAGIVTQLLG